MWVSHWGLQSALQMEQLKVQQMERSKAQHSVRSTGQRRE